VSGREGSIAYLLLRMEPEAGAAVKKVLSLQEAIVEHMPSMIIVKDPETLRFKWVNRPGAAFLGRSPDELVGSSDHDVFPEAQANFLESVGREALAQRKVVEVPDVRIETPGGDRWLNAKKIPILHDDGTPIGLLVLADDITERKRASEALRAQNAELVAREAELAAQKAELKQRNLDLARADQMKSNFLATMSHELRTPLNAVLGFADLLIADEYGALGPLQKPVVRDILVAGRQLLALIDDVLNLSKIEAGRVEVRATAVDVGQLVTHACTMVASLAEARSIDIVNRVPPGVHRANADPTRVLQVLNNLVSNAVKFTPDGGTVVMEASDTAEEVRIAVTDTGIGIAPEDGPRLFAPFSQLDSGYARHFQGTGIGLSICKHLVERMGGEIGFTSEAGKGSTFFFTLPTAPAGRLASSDPLGGATMAPPPPSSSRAGATVLLVEGEERGGSGLQEGLEREGYRVTRVTSGEAALTAIDEVRPAVLVIDLALPGMSGQQLIDEVRASLSWGNTPIAVLSAVDLEGEERTRLNETVQIIGRPGDASRSELFAQMAAIVPRNRPRVLLVDDSEMNRKVIRAMLQRTHCEVTELADGESALRAAAAEPAPAVILMDIQMPGMDGLVATTRLKADPATRAIPVIAVTAHAMEGDAERALAVGCLAHVSKPVARVKLFLALDLALGGAAWRSLPSLEDG
jgi:PAS domain S-box-containing protein